MISDEFEKQLQLIVQAIDRSEKSLLMDCGIEKNAIEIRKSAEKARRVSRWMIEIANKAADSDRITIQLLFATIEANLCYLQCSGFVRQFNMRENARERLGKLIKQSQEDYADAVAILSEMLKIADEAPYKWELLLKLLAEKHNLEHTWIELTEEEKSLKYFEEFAPRASIFGF